MASSPSLSCEGCILAAVYGDFDEGCNELAIDVAEAYMYGFDAHTPDEYMALEAEWERRLAAAK